MRVTPFAVALYAVFVTTLFLVTLYAAFTATGDPKAPPAPHWIYGPRQTYSTGQTGVIVYCQGKTNSKAFAARKHAAPGDVVIQTCRAVRG